MHSDLGEGDGRGAVLLAAGRGSRLSELTDQTHKSLLRLGGRPAIGHIIEALTEAGVTDIVVVTGYRAEDVRAFVAAQHEGAPVSFAHNPHWATDTNILSTEVGVTGLVRPEDGYLIVETDVALDQGGWQHVVASSRGNQSVWFTKGLYSRELTGGCLASHDSRSVSGIAYAPDYDSAFEGWHKLLGILYVAPPQVRADRTLRQRALKASTMQYYLQPYVDHPGELPCSYVDLGDSFAMSFNDLDAYRMAADSLPRVDD